MKKKTNKKKRKNSKNTERFSSLTPRTKAIDSLSSPRAPCRAQSAKQVKNIFVRKNQINKSTEAEKLLLPCSGKPIEFKCPFNFRPNLKRNNKPKLKTEKEIKVLKSSSTEIVELKKVNRRKKKSNSPPQESNKKQDLACLKDLIEKITPKYQSEQMDLNKLGIVEKSEFLKKSKSQKLAQEENSKKEIKDFNFKPTLSAQTDSSHKKTKSLTIFRSKQKSINKKDSPVIKTEFKPSPSSYFHRKNPASLSEKGTFLSSTLGMMSPGNRPNAKELSDKLQRLSIPSKLK